MARKYALMREGNGSRRQSAGLDNSDRMEHGYGVENNNGAAGDRES